ncbi:MAG: ATP-binding protein, partial [Myxococcaceae bacterium]
PALPTVSSEKVPLQQVFMNLVSNALKYARRADAEVRVSSSDEGAFVRFSIADNGPGIAPQDQNRIWGIFQMLSSHDKKVEGTGIGLAVVKKLVETRGGRIWVESDLGQGATFHFTWLKQGELGSP